MALSITFTQLYGALESACLDYKQLSETQPARQHSFFGGSDEHIPSSSALFRAEEWLKAAKKCTTPGALLACFHNCFDEYFGGWIIDRSLKPLLLKKMLEAFGTPRHKPVAFTQASALTYLDYLRSSLQDFNLSEEEQDRLNQMSELLRKTSCWNAQMFQHLLEQPQLVESILPEVSRLFYDRRLNSRTLALIFNHPDLAVRISESLLRLHSQDFHPYENTNDDFPVSLDPVLTQLNARQLLTRNTLDHLLTYPRHAQEVGQTLLLLQDHGLLTPGRLDRLLRSPQHACLLRAAITDLHTQHALSNTTLYLLFAYSHAADRLAPFWIWLENRAALSEADCEQFAQNTHAFSFMVAILSRMPMDAPRLSPLQWEALIQQAPLFGQPGVFHAIQNLPASFQITPRRIQQWLAYGELYGHDPASVARAIQANLQRQEQVRQQPQRQLNESQSTHTASVHSSISASARRLNTLYGEHDERATLQAISTWIMGEAQNEAPEAIVRAARRAFRRIRNTDCGDHLDPASGIRTRRLLTFVWAGTHDSPQWDVTPSVIAQGIREENGQFIPVTRLLKRRLLQALYECQRGYNLNEQGEDDHQEDSSICRPGTFNKLMEPLNTVHKAVEIVFVNRELATSALPAIARHEAATYLSAMARDATTLEAQAAFHRFLARLSAEGFVLIWEAIHESIHTRFFTEYGGVFNQQREFDALVNCAREDVELTEAEQDAILANLPALADSLLDEPSLYRVTCARA